MNHSEAASTVSGVSVTSPGTPLPTQLSSGVAVLITTIVVLFTVPLIVANGMVIVAFLQDSQLRMTRNYYIFNLAVADLIIGVFVIPFYTTTIWTWTWTFGRHMCTLWNIIDDTTLTVSHYSILLISYDRYLLVNDALLYNANEIPRRAITRISVTWVIVVVVKIVLIIVSEWYYYGTHPQSESPCSSTSKVDIPYIINVKEYDLVVTTFTLVVEVLLPLALIMAFNFKVYNTIHKRTRKGSAVSNLIRQSIPPCHMIANVEIPHGKNAEGMANSNFEMKTGLEFVGDGGKGKQRRHTQNALRKSESKASIGSQFPILDTIDELDVVSLSSHTNQRPPTVVDVWEKTANRTQYANNAKSEHIYNIKRQIWDDDATMAINLYTTPKGDHISDVEMSPVENLHKEEHVACDVSNGESSMKCMNDTASISENHTLPPSELTDTSGDEYMNAETWSVTLSSSNSSLSNLNMETFLFDSAVENHNVKEDDLGREESVGSIPPLEAMERNTVQRISVDYPSGFLTKRDENRPSIKSVRFSTPEVQMPHFISKPPRLTRQNSSCNKGRRRARSSTISLPKYKDKQDRKAAITLSVLVFLFIIFKLPMAIIMLVLATCNHCVNGLVFLVFTWIFRAKSLVNPFLYAFISKRFRLYYLHLLQKIFCKKNKVGSVAVSKKKPIG